MANAGETLRLAIGIFYEPARLDRAITDLRADGVAAEELCLVGTPDAFEKARQHESDASGQPAGAAAHPELRDLGELIEGCRLSASPGPLLQTLLKHGKWSKDDGPVASDWLWPELLARLSDHLCKGALVLVVCTPTFASQHKSSRILLRHSAHTVQTHEFMPQR